MSAEAEAPIDVPPAMYSSESFIAQIEQVAQDIALESYGQHRRILKNLIPALINFPGLKADLQLPPENVLPMRPCLSPPPLSDLGLGSDNPNAFTLASYWVNVHLDGIHHNTPFLHPPQLHDILGRCFDRDLRNTRVLLPEELALIYIVLALGSLRADTYDSVSGRHHPLANIPADASRPSTKFPPSALQPAMGTGEVSLALYRHAVGQIEYVVSPSETAVQALFLLHTYVSNTMMGRKSRDFVARAVMMAHETELNRLTPIEAGETGLAKRRAVLFLYVYFSDV